MAQVPCIYRSEGDYIDYTPMVDTPAGEVVLLGNRVLIAPAFIAANTQGVLATRGVWRMPKTGDYQMIPGHACEWRSNGSPVGGTVGSGGIVEAGSGLPVAGWVTAFADFTDATVDVQLTSGVTDLPPSSLSAF